MSNWFKRDKTDAKSTDTAKKSTSSRSLKAVALPFKGSAGADIPSAVKARQPTAPVTATKRPVVDTALASGFAKSAVPIATASSKKSTSVKSPRSSKSTTTTPAKSTGTAPKTAPKPSTKAPTKPATANPSLTDMEHHSRAQSDMIAKLQGDLDRATQREQDAKRQIDAFKRQDLEYKKIRQEHAQALEDKDRMIQQLSQQASQSGDKNHAAMAEQAQLVQKYQQQIRDYSAQLGDLKERNAKLNEQIDDLKRAAASRPASRPETGGLVQRRPISGNLEETILQEREKSKRLEIQLACYKEIVTNSGDIVSGNSSNKSIVLFAGLIIVFSFVFLQMLASSGRKVYM